MNLITGALILGNAIKHPLEECVSSTLPWIDELIIYHDSTDGSLEKVLSLIPSSFKVKVVRQKGDVDFGRFRNECIDLAQTPWIHFFFSDEVIEVLDNTYTPKTHRLFLENCLEPCIALARFNEPDGQDYPDFQANLVRKGMVKFYRRIHEIPSVTPRICLSSIRIRHKLKPLSELEKRDQRWMEVDPQTEQLHRSRPEIQRRLKSEYEKAPRS